MVRSFSSAFGRISNYYELLKLNETVTGDRYRLQMMRFSRVLEEKRPLYEQRHDKVILLHGDTRPHVAKPVKTYLETIKWEVLPHSPYSPDIALPIITYSVRWHMKIAKNGSILG